jgi:hypothetical protein
MANESAHTKWSFMVAQSYQPVLGSDPGERIAHALEYIAAHIGQINAKLDRLSAPEK